MPDLSDAELAELEMILKFDDSYYRRLVVPRVIAEVRRLRAENAELRERGADAAASIQAAMNIAGDMEKIVKSR